MGRETANVHLANRDAGSAILGDLEHRPADWLRTAAETMIEATRRDWKEWCKAARS